MDNLFQCIRCGSAAWRRQTDAHFVCGGCGHAYPVALGVPLLVEGITARPSGYHLPDATAAAVCRHFAMPVSPENVAALRALFARSYQTPNQALTAENDYLLHRLELADPRHCPPLRSRFTKSPVNQDVRLEFLSHLVPERLPPGTTLSRNVRVANAGASVVTSRAARPVYLSYHWRSAGGEVVEWEGLRTPLPTDLCPGHALTVPLMLRTPPRPGPLVLELTAVHEGVRWLDDFARQLRVVVAAEADDAPPAGWQLNPGPQADYQADHEAARALLAEEIERHRHADMKVLELGCQYLPETEALRLPCPVYGVDIDVQTLQLARLRPPRGPNPVRFVCADAHRLPFVADAFDCVAVFATLHHLAQPVAVLREVRRVLRPGGFLAVLCEPAFHYSPAEPPEDLLRALEMGINEQVFALPELDFLFRQAGLEAYRVQVDGGSFKGFLRKNPAKALAVPPWPPLLLTLRPPAGAA